MGGTCVDRDHAQCSLLHGEETPKRQVASDVAHAWGEYVTHDCTIELHFACDAAQQELRGWRKCSDPIDECRPARLWPVLRIATSISRSPPLHRAFVARLN